RQGAKFPPLVVFDDCHQLWLADGFHRYAAAQRAGLTEIDVQVDEGMRHDAILYAVFANGKNGIRWTRADKRRAVKMLLACPEWAGWSDREISRRCGVSPDTVGRIRKDVCPSLSESDSEVRTYTTKHGTTATMNTANIGKS